MKQYSQPVTQIVLIDGQNVMVSYLTINDSSAKVFDVN